MLSWSPSRSASPTTKLTTTCSTSISIRKKLNAARASTACAILGTDHDLEPSEREISVQVWTVIFLLDSVQPQRVMMLKRAPWKPFAPDMYTGIGGKEEIGEGPLACALRELEEETGLTNIALTEFARCVLDGQKSLHYYRGIYPQPNP
ncbi:MAG: NUDIX domain-containing protein, partial [Anaerolineae bacterium]|nr:NUDIX domain-containing protein [Anaerolineae bacterium]